MPKKRILHVIGGMNDGGAQRVVLDYMERKSSLKQYDLLFLSLSGPIDSLYDKYIKENDLPMSYLKYRRSESRIGFIRKLLNWLRRTMAIWHFVKVNNIDAIHTHVTGIFINMFLILCIFKGEKFHTMHSDPYELPKGLVLLSKFLFFYKKVHPIAVSEGQCQKAICRYKLKNCDLVRNSIDVAGIQNYVADLDRISLRRKFKLPLKGFLIGSVGRLHFIKNYDLLIKIFYSYKSKTSEDVFLVIVGDGPEEENLKNLIAKLDLCSSVFLINSVSHHEVYEIYKMIDLFMLVSKLESSSMVTLEAQAVGTRCLLSRSIPADVVYRSNVRRMDLDADLNEWCIAINDDKYINDAVCHENEHDLRTIMKRLEDVYRKYL